MTASRAKYERMLGDLRQELRPQREWGEGRGVLMVIGHFVVGLAAGTWLLSTVLGSTVGAATAIVLGGLGGLVHLGFLARPERAWRMISRFRTSWVSRGFAGLALFLVGAALYVPPLLSSAWAWQANSLLGAVGYVAALAGMAMLIVYMGFVYTVSKAVPFWNSPLHPALYMMHALRGGVAVMLVVVAAGEALPGAGKQLLIAWIGVTLAVAVLFVLEMHGALFGSSAAARRSAEEMVKGRLSRSFYGGMLGVGLVVPAVLIASGATATLSTTAMAVIGIASVAGDLFMKLTMVRAGVYLPLTVAGRR